MESGLYVVATPIGNISDISLRALEVLRMVDLIAAEDTRHSHKLLQSHDIDTVTMAYHDHSDARALERISDCLAGGGAVALVSDAGTPLISDPGYRLVREMQSRGFRVVAIPGPCAAIAALSVSGLPTDRFLFEGFLPSRDGARANRLQALSKERVTLVFYEAPHRIAACLHTMVEVLGANREAVLARELTKTFETIRRGSLAELVDFVREDANQQKGEIVLLVAGAGDVAADIDARTAELLALLITELPAKKAAALVAQYTGLRKKQLYEFLVSIKQG